MKDTQDGSAQPATSSIRVSAPGHLRALARVDGEMLVEVAGTVTVAAVVNALEAAHPPLAGTIRDRASGRRRAMIRVYADGQDYSDDWDATALPDAVVQGREPLRLVGAIAGG